MARGMSERRRAFFALQGERFPRVGERGWWSGPKPPGERHSPRGRVEVVRLSASGHTIWTRFTSAHSRKRFGDESHRWWLRARGPHNIAYCSFGNDLYGTVWFGDHQR